MHETLTAGHDLGGAPIPPSPLGSIARKAEQMDV